MGNCSTKKKVKTQLKVVKSTQGPNQQPGIERQQQKSQTSIVAKTVLSDTTNGSVITYRSTTKVSDEEIQIKSGLFRIYTILGCSSDFLQESDDQYIKIVEHNVTGVKKRVEILNKVDTSTQNLILKIKKNRLQNQYICPITNIYEDKEMYYILSDYCSGGSLSKLKGKLNDNQVTILLNQMVTAISYLHSHKIAHGKLSIDSFHLLRDENSLFCKLIDVTSLFCRREQEKREPSQKDYAQDIYSIGTICYQLLTGLMPFQILSNKQQENNENVLTLYFNEGTTPTLKKLLEKMLQKKLSERIQMDELKTQLSKNDMKNQYSDNLIKSLYFLSKCKPRNYIHIVILPFMLSIFDFEEKQILEKIFHDVDIDQDDLLKKEDIIRLYKSIIDYDTINNDVDQLLQKLDTKNKEALDKNEFISAVMNLEELLSLTNLKICFKQLQNQRGYITCKSIKKKQFEINEELFNQTLKDINGQHQLNFNEFAELMRQLQ